MDMESNNWKVKTSALCFLYQPPVYVWQVQVLVDFAIIFSATTSALRHASATPAHVSLPAAARSPVCHARCPFRRAAHELLLLPLAPVRLAATQSPPRPPRWGRE